MKRIITWIQTAAAQLTPNAAYPAALASANLEAPRYRLVDDSEPTLAGQADAGPVKIAPSFGARLTDSLAANALSLLAFGDETLSILAFAGEPISISSFGA